jgi:hypothetical protein
MDRIFKLLAIVLPFFLVGCYKEPQDQLAIIYINAAQDKFQADSITENAVKVIIARKNGLPPNDIINRTVTITTTIGLFSNGTVTATGATDPSGSVTFLLSSSRPGSGIVTANLESIIIKDTTITFNLADPDTMIFVNTSATAISGADSTPLIANGQLNRKVGRVSAGYYPTLQALDSLGHPIPNMIIGNESIPSTVAGAFSFALTMPDSTFTGKIMLKASLKTATTQLSASFGPVYYYKPK